jgi:hypothetical protein
MPLPVMNNTTEMIWKGSLKEDHPAQQILERMAGTIQGTTTDTYTGMPRAGTKSPDPVNPPSPVPLPPVYPGKPHLPSGMKGTVAILVEDVNGGHRGILARRGDGIPKAEWRVFTNGDVEGPPSLYGVCYNERFNEGEFTGLISFNVAFTLFTTEIEYWQAEYPKADPKAVEDVVKHAYEEEMIARIKHIMSLRGKTVGITPEGEKVPFGQNHAKLLTEPAALTASLFGLINVEQGINTAAGGKFGRKVSAAA